MQVDERKNERRIELVAKEKKIGLTSAEFKELKELTVYFRGKNHDLYAAYDDAGLR